ncbi:MAG: hypothetical protein ABSE73_05780 [Planctomycetota bacterium]
MPKTRLTWKWKLTIVLVVLFMFMIGFVISQSGNEWIRDKIVEKFEALPVSEQRDSSWANYYLAEAWWAGFTGKTTQAMDMYKQFCGVAKDAKGKDPIDDQTGRVGKLVGLCSPKGETGWGPMHPRAPEAFYSGLDLFDTETSASSQYIHREIFNYYRLFYTWAVDHSPDHKPHPKFNVYWNKIMFRLKRDRIYWPPDIDRNAPLALPAPKEEE